MSIPDPQERPTLSVPEAGALVGLGRSASFDAARRGELPTLKFGRRLVVPTALLRRLLGFDAATDAPDGEALAAAPGLALFDADQEATGT